MGIKVYQLMLNTLIKLHLKEKTHLLAFLHRVISNEKAIINIELKENWLIFTYHHIPTD